MPNRESSSQENENRDIENRNGLVRQKKTFRVLSDEMNARFTREMDSTMDLIQSQISRAISSAINDRVIPEIQSIMGILLLNRDGPEPWTSLNEDGNGNAWKHKNTKFQRRNPVSGN